MSHYPPPATRHPQIILALDVSNYRQAMQLVSLLSPRVKIFKVGLQLYTACGPKIIEFIHKKGAQAFLDLKFNDIPNTMVNAAKGLLKYKVAMFTVHTLSGPTALKAVASVCKGSKTKVLGVTILTSICPRFLKDLKIQRTLNQEVLYLAKMAKRCGLDGVVSSVEEAALIRRALGRNFLIVTPGIRPKGYSSNDHARVATFEDAVRAGADYIIVGRPILEAKDPFWVTENILA